MPGHIACKGAGAFLLAGLVAIGALMTGVPRAAADDPSPFEKVLGRWVGEGRLGVRNNATERVKCRVTYILAGAPDQLQQTIRCASGSGNIEVRSTVEQKGGALSGTWTELVRNMSGKLTGTVTARGFRVSIKGADLHANMDIVILGAKQVVEIQFIDSSLIGLTIILDKG